MRLGLIVQAFGFVALAVLALVSVAGANTITAASCSQADVQTAINAAGAGDVVVIPAGTCTWTARVSWTAPANAVLMGAGTNVVGGGDQTVIVDNVAGNVPLLNITTNATGSFRLSGITFRRGTGTTRDQGPITFGGSSHSFRVDHVHLDNLPGNGQIIVNGNIWGVFDHIRSDSSGVVNAIKIFHGGWNGGDSLNVGDASWADDTTFGSQRFVFIEDSVFNGGAVNDCSSGGRFVIRRSTITTFAPPSLGIQTHPTGGGARHRGCRAHEIYQNTFIAANSSIDAAVWISSGTALVWGNTISQGGGNSYARFIKSLSMRANNATYPQAAPPQGWGYCGPGQTGLPSNFDQNTDGAGWKCIDDPGIGKGDLLNNDFGGSGPFNAATGCNSTQACVWPRQASEPIYEWSNSIGATTRWTASGSAVQANRDYYFTNASFNGTSGTGSGPTGSRPLTCSPKVAYWDTTTNTLYQCSSTNTWTPYYTPYTYPHPLVSGSPAGPPPNSPSNPTLR